MANLTISVDDALIKRARVRAIEQGTSLSAKVREFLQHFVDEPGKDLSRQRAQATARLMAAIHSASAQARRASDEMAVDAGPRRTLREEMYAGDFRAVHRREMADEQRKATEEPKPPAAARRRRSR